MWVIACSIALDEMALHGFFFSFPSKNPGQILYLFISFFSMFPNGRNGHLFSLQKQQMTKLVYIKIMLAFFYEDDM